MKELRDEIVALKKRLWDVEKKLSAYYDMQHEVSTSNIDFIAMEAGIDLDQDAEEVMGDE